MAHPGTGTVGRCGLSLPRSLTSSTERCPTTRIAKLLVTRSRRFSYADARPAGEPGRARARVARRSTGRSCGRRRCRTMWRSSWRSTVRCGSGPCGSASTGRSPHRRSSSCSHDSGGVAPALRRRARRPRHAAVVRGWRMAGRCDGAASSADPLDVDVGSGRSRGHRLHERHDRPPEGCGAQPVQPADCRVRCWSRVAATTARCARATRFPLTILNMPCSPRCWSSQAGGTSVIMDRIDADGVAEWIRDERVTTWNGPPAVLHSLATMDEVAPEDLASLGEVWIGGADCPEAIRSRLRAEVRYSRARHVRADRGADRRGHRPRRAGPTSTRRQRPAAPSPRRPDPRRRRCALPVGHSGECASLRPPAMTATASCSATGGVRRHTAKVARRRCPAHRRPRLRR